MINFVPQWKLLGLVLTLLTGCVRESSSPVTVCPPLKEYTRKFQLKLADEIEAASMDAIFPIALQDYALLRHQVRAGCR